MPIGPTSGFLDFTNATPRADVIIALSNVGVGTDVPLHALDIRGTANVADIIINNDLTLIGGLTTNTLTINSVSMSTTSNFQQVTNVGNATTNTVQFTNPTTGFTVSSNAEVGGELSVSGNVGIGTTSPTRKLHVYTSASEGNTQLLLQSANRYSSLHMKDSGGGIIAQNDQGTFRLITGYDASDSGGTEKFRVTGSGNVGIGTAGPLQTLHVAGNGENPVIYMADSTNTRYASGMGTHHVSNEGQRLDFYNGDSGANGTSLGSSHIRMSINALGNVGIGTTSPSVYLDVAGSANNGKSLQLRSGDSSGDTDSSQIIFSYNNNPYNSGGYAHSIRTRHNSGTDTGNAIEFWLWNTTDTTDENTLGNKRVMTLEGDGNVGIGTTNPGAKLDVNGVMKNLNPSWNLYFTGTGSVTSGTLSFNNIKVPARNCTLNTSGGLTSRVTITVAGRYFIGFNGFTESSVLENTGVEHSLRINGSTHVRNYHAQPIDNYSAMGGLGCLVDLSVNDYVEITSSHQLHHNENASFYGFMIG